MDELRAGLELATEEELRALTEILFCRKFNPIDYVCTPEPIDIESQGRRAWLDAVEERFRFLAADGLTVLQRKTRQVSYRQVLIQVCRYLKIPYTADLSTTDLEAEIFLTLLNRVWQKLPAAKKRMLNRNIQAVISQSQLAQQIPSPIQQDPVGLVLRGSGALAVNSFIRPWILQQIAHQFAIHAATHRVASETLVRGGVAAATRLQTQVALQTASRGMAVNAARYGAARTVFAFLGSALWVWFFADLGWRAIATNYGRIIPVVFTLAQIRLTRSDYFQPAFSG